TGQDQALAHVENMALPDGRIQIGRAAMVDNLRAAAAEGAIDRPVIVQREQIGMWTVSAALGFAPPDLLPRIFNYFAVWGDAFQSKHTAMVNPRFANFQSETRIIGIDSRSFDESHAYASSCSAIAGTSDNTPGALKWKRPIVARFKACNASGVFSRE